MAGMPRPARRERGHGKPGAAGEMTLDNIAYMEAQLKSLGFALIGARARHLPARLLSLEPMAVPAHAGKGHRLPEDGSRQLGSHDKTVLANEQVIDGRGWRTGALVEKREIPMYYLRSRLCRDLLDALRKHAGWPERVRAMQANWIARARGEAGISVRDRRPESCTPLPRVPIPSWE